MLQELEWLRFQHIKSHNLTTHFSPNFISIFCLPNQVLRLRHFQQEKYLCVPSNNNKNQSKVKLIYIF